MLLKLYPLLQGLITLVDNHLCHLMLRPILPQLQSHIHDTSEKVRVAMVNLLLKVKGVRAIKVKLHLLLEVITLKNYNSLFL